MSDLLNSASLVLIPSGYKEDTVYSVVPSDGSGDLSFTRASNGTRVNTAGLVEVVPWNLLEYSEQFDNGVWTKDQLTITADTTTAPNGTLTADTLTILSAAGHLLRQAVAVIPSSVYTFSFYIKRGTATALNYSIYDLTNAGNIVASTSYYSQTSSSEWTRISVSFTTPSGCVSIGCYPSRDSSSTGTAFIWGAQLNIGSTAKPYFPTTDRLNVPRLTYQNGGGGCPSLLLEKQSTNHILYSEDFSQTAWTKNGVALTTNATTSPDGTTNADLLTSNDPSASVYRIYEANPSGSDAVCTTSVYFKYGNWQYVFILGDNYSGSARYAVFDLINITNTFVSSGYTATITSVGDGWYKCTFTGEMKSDTYNQFGLAPTSTTYFSISIANGKTLYVWGTQREQSSYPTSYIPTTSSSATRVADECKKTGISSLIGQTEGVVFVDFVYNGLATDGSNIFNMNRNVTSSVYMIRLTNSTMEVGVAIGGVGVAKIIGGAISVGTRIKLAYAYKSGSSALYINGSQIGTSSDAFTIVTSMSEINLNDVYTYFSNQQAVNFNEAVIFQTRLTNAELASLTTI